MKTIVSQAMNEGAFGISTESKISTWKFSKVDEIIEISKRSQKKEVSTHHLRDEGLEVLA